MIFCPYNLITSDNATVNGELVNYPKEDMLNNRLTDRTFMQDYIDVDMGVATNIPFANLISDQSSLLLLGNSSASWTSPAFSKLLTKSINTIDETYRYWRLVTEGRFPLEYVNGDDVNLDFPSIDYDTDYNYIPFADSGGGIELFVGNDSWSSFSIPVDRLTRLAGAGTPSAYGSIEFHAPLGNWTDFVSSANDGLTVFTMPKNADYDTLGGYFDYYYSNSAFVAAFTGNQNFVLITQNGSVYSNSISTANLVVRWDGVKGNAGGGSMITDTVRYGTGTALVGHFYLGPKLNISNPRAGVVQDPRNTDIKNSSISGQKYNVDGVLIIDQEFEFRRKSKTEHDIAKDFSISSYRNRAGMFAQTEEDTELHPPYFATMKFNFDSRVTFGNEYNFAAIVEECK